MVKGVQHSWTFRAGAAVLSGMTYITNIFMPFASAKQILTIAGGILVGGILLDKLLDENEYEKVFRLCGLVNSADQVPVVIKKTNDGRKTTLVIHMPAGISQEDFEKRQQKLEQYFNAKIQFGFNKNLIIDLIEMNLRTRYDYVFEELPGPLQIYCGETYSGKFILDIEKCPHAIIAGETDSGKSSLLDVITLSLLLNKHNVELRLIDFQAVTLGKYENCRKVKSYGETPEDFDKLMDEMAEENSRRIKLFRSVKNRNYIDKLSDWNKFYPKRALPYIVVIIDEFARLAEKDNEEILKKFRTRVSMDRKTGIHYIVSMQRPDVKVIEGSIKANMPTRLAFKTVTDTDSEVILDQGGAEQLKNQGRFLAKYCGELTEVQALYVEPYKIRKILKANNLIKSEAEIETEKQKEIDELKEKRKEQIRKFRETYINPYNREALK